MSGNQIKSQAQKSFKRASEELFFSSFYGQAGVNGDGGNSSVSEPGFSPQEEGAAEFQLWSPSAHSDLYELSNCALNSMSSRRNTEKKEIEEEVDLQCLVSSILDEGDDVQSGFYNSGNPSFANGLWCPKTLREDFLQYSQLQSQDTLPYSDPSEVFNQSQVMSKNEQFFQKLSGISANPHWQSSVPNGDRASHGSHPNRWPTVLPIPKTANHFPPQTLENYDLSSDLHPTNHRPVNNFPQISDAFQLQNKMSRPLFDHYESATSTKPNRDNEQDVPEHMNQLVSGLQSFLADESNPGRFGCFPNIVRKTEYPEDSILEQRKFPSQSMPMLHEKQLEGEFWGRDVTPAFKHKDVQEILGLGNENAEYSPQSMSLNPPNQYHNNINGNQYSYPHSKQVYKMKSLIQKDMKMTAGSSETAPRVAETHRRPHVDHLGGMERFNGENIMGNVQPFIPPAHVDSHPRRFTQPPFKSQKDTTPQESSPGMTPSSVMEVNGAAALYSHLKGAEAHSGGSAFKDRAAALHKTPEGLVIQFYLHLDECSEQLHYLESERKKIEAILAKAFPGEWTPPLSPPGLPLTPTRLDRLIFNQRREQANVDWLLSNLEYVCNVPLHPKIRLSLDNHRQALSCIQVRRGEELANASKQQRLGAPLTEEHDLVLSVFALKELAVATCKLRKDLWCALQLSVPSPIRRPEKRSDAERELCTSLWCSFLMTAPAPVKKPEADANREERRTQSRPYSVRL